MKKIALVVVRYGKDINGGAEYHAQLLAEHLRDDYQVEVLTTCVRDGQQGTNDYREGADELNGVLIRRFKVVPYNRSREQQLWKKAKAARKWRRFLYQLRLLKLISYVKPIWTYKEQEELEAMRAFMFNSPDLARFIGEHKAEYEAFIAMSLDYPTFYDVAMLAGEKTIAVPTMHYVGLSFRSMLTRVVSQLRYVGFNSGEEMRLGERIFGKALHNHGILSVGIEEIEPSDWETTQRKYHLPDDYLLYVGRVTKVKLYRLIPYFLAYKKKYPLSTLKLVLVGGVTIARVSHPDILYTGYVSDSDKMAILQHAKIVVNPSNGESLSLIVLEAMSQAKPLLLNGRCKVLKEHCIKSCGGAWYYLTKASFVRKLHAMANSATLREEIASKGKAYYLANYNWDLIMSRLKQAINQISAN